MAQVTVCDRCNNKVGVDPGMKLSVQDTTRGMDTRSIVGTGYDLCGNCAESFVLWFKMEHRGWTVEEVKAGYFPDSHSGAEVTD